MENFLDPGDRIKLEEILNSNKTDYHRPAQILILTDQGNSIRQIAAKLNLSRSSVFYWIRRYRNQKMMIFNLQSNSTLDETITKDSRVRKPKAKKAPTKTTKKKTKTSDSKRDSNMGEFNEIVDLISLKPVNINSPGISPNDPVAEAGRKTLRFHFIQMIKNEQDTLAGEDIEALHDMRVATRRMRAAFDVVGFGFKKKGIKFFLKGLRQTGRALGRVRDFDVLMEKANQYLENRPANERLDLAPLMELWRNHREVERAFMKTHLESQAYAEFKTKFDIFLNSPGAGAVVPMDAARSDIQSPIGIMPGIVKHIVPLLVYQRLAAVDSYGPLIPSATTMQLHALRIEFKRLRYTFEFFSEVLGPQAKWVIQEIKLIQDHLGDLNDAEVAINLLGEVLNQWENQHSQIPFSERPNPRPILDYLSFRVQERHDLLNTFLPVWNRFSQFEFREQLALAVAAL